MRYLLSFITLLMLLPTAIAHENDGIREGDVHATVEEGPEIFREVTQDDGTVTQVPTGMYRLTYRDEDGNVLSVVIGKLNTRDKPQHIHYEDGGVTHYWDVLEGEHTHTTVVGHTDDGIPLYDCLEHSHTYIIPWHSHDKDSDLYEPGPEGDGNSEVLKPIPEGDVDDSEVLESILEEIVDGAATAPMLGSSRSGSMYNDQRPNVVVTEYMMQASELPQWIEVYNRGEVRVDVRGWKFVVWQQQHRKRAVTLQRSVSIPPKGFIVFVNRDLKVGEYGGIDAKRVRLYPLNELGRNRYIRRFQILDTQGRFIENGNQSRSMRFGLRNGNRHSYDVINRSVVNQSENAAWIGDPSDRSTLGSHAFAEGTRASPVSPRILATKWAALKEE